VIVILDQDLFKAELFNAEATLKDAQANLAREKAGLGMLRDQIKANAAEAETIFRNADQKYQRARELLRKNLISREEFDNAKAEWEKATFRLREARARKGEVKVKEANILAAEAKVQLAEGQLELAKVKLGHSVIRAPISGVVIEKNVEAGQTVAASFQVPKFVTIADLTKMKVDAWVDEADIGRIEPGDEVEFTVDSYPYRIFEGRVFTVYPTPQVRENVVSYDTEIHVNNEDLALKPGMTANVSIIVARRPDVLVAPQSALRITADEIQKSYPEISLNGDEPEEGHSIARLGFTPGEGRVWIHRNGTPERVKVRFGATDLYRVEAKRQHVRNTMTCDPVIQIKDVTKAYDMGEYKVEALKGVSFAVYPGEIVALVGPSGSGKSTLMNILGCLDQPTSGVYELLGSDVSHLSRNELAFLRNREIGFVFQNYNLVGRTSALENVALPMLYNGTSRAERERRADEMLNLVGLTGREDHQPTQLSGGQQQRVAIARALSNTPRFILADEPTGNLDSQTGGEIIELIEQLNREKGLTVIFVTHDTEVASHSHRVIYLKDGLIEREENKTSRHHVPEGEVGEQASSMAVKGSGGASLATNLRAALRALQANKLRSVLTMLGVIIGVAAVIAMVGIGDGTRRKVTGLLEKLGTTRVGVYAGSHTKGRTQIGAGSTTSLTVADAHAIEKEVRGV